MNFREGSLPGSFRDPSGYVFMRNGILHRHVNEEYREHYETLMGCGLYETLTAQRYLIPHQESLPEEGAYKILVPEMVPFVSYPYEWCFGQLRAAALLTLNIQEAALEHGMTLKDASAYNVQFRGSAPVFIDTLSFEKYRAGSPWVAYRQFCQHFLAPLALMSRSDARLGNLSRVFLDGVPLDLASKLLPLSSRFSPGLLMHVYLHSKSQKLFADKPVRPVTLNMPKSSLRNLVSSLRDTVAGLKMPGEKTEWGTYYRDNSYSDVALTGKLSLLTDMLKASNPKMVWDVGGNSGFFSRAASGLGTQTISFDLDHAAIEASYRMGHEKNELNLLPLVLDITNPSPALGWANKERFSLAERGPADALLALALVHHLAISNHLPFEKIAETLAGMCRVLIIEFVPKTDVQVKRLLASRGDSFPNYHEDGFVTAFSQYFRILESRVVPDSPRTLYQMEKLTP